MRCEGARLRLLGSTQGYSRSSSCRRQPGNPDYPWSGICCTASSLQDAHFDQLAGDGGWGLTLDATSAIGSRSIWWTDRAVSIHMRTANVTTRWKAYRRALLGRRRNRFVEHAQHIAFIVFRFTSLSSADCSLPIFAVFPK